MVKTVRKKHRLRRYNQKKSNFRRSEFSLL